MYCPLCGNKMEQLSKDCDHIDCEWQDEHGDWVGDIHNESIHWCCGKEECPAHNNHLIQHAAPWPKMEDEINDHFKNIGGADLRGIYWLNPPDESWSLSFGKTVGY
jgi:hypothetical protein